MSDSQTFTVVVSDYFEIGFGGAVVRLGESGAVALTAVSSGPVTHAVFDVPLPAGRLTDVVLLDVAPDLAGASLQPTAAGIRIELTATPDKPILGSRQWARFGFTAAPDLPSAFVALQATGIEAVTAAGPLQNTVGRPGRLVIVGLEPLLEAQFTSWQSRRLVLYGEPGAHVQLQTTRALNSGVPWQLWRETDLAGLIQVIDDVPIGEETLFYRALRP